MQNKVSAFLPLHAAFRTGSGALLLGGPWPRDHLGTSKQASELRGQGAGLAGCLGLSREEGGAGWSSAKLGCDLQAASIG